MATSYGFKGGSMGMVSSFFRTVGRGEAGVHAVGVTHLIRPIAFSLKLKHGRLRELGAITFGEPWPETWPDLSTYRLECIDDSALLDTVANR
jgi:hypothetical protein